MRNTLILLAKNLRKDSTDAEKLFWRYLRSKQMGLKYRRQQPIGKYIVDFVCFESKLIIELDGSQHLQQTEKDKARDNWFKQQGYKVLRFWDNEVLTNITGTLERIKEVCLGHPPLNPLPSRAGRERK